MKKIYFMSPLKDEARSLFDGFEVVEQKKALSKEEFIEAITGFDYVVSSLTQKVDREVFEKAGVKFYNNYGVGYDNLDIATAKELGITVCNCPNAVTISTAEEGIALLFAATRKVPFGHNSAHLHGCGNKAVLEGLEVFNKTVGIIGAGSIGQTVAKFLSGFDVKIVYNKRNRDLAFEEKQNAKYASVEELLQVSDYVFLTCPLTSETENLINKNTLKLMKPNAILVNIARGKVVNHDDLIDALDNKQIRACALDVFPEEPSIPAGLLNRDDVVLSPHIAGLTHEAKMRLYAVVRENIRAFEAGEVPFGLLTK